MTAEGEKNIVCSCTTGAVGRRHDARLSHQASFLQEKLRDKILKELSKNVQDPRGAARRRDSVVADAWGSPADHAPRTPRLKPSFPQFLGVLEADRAHLSPASAEENDASKVMCSPCGQPEPKDSSLEETKVRLMSLASDKDNSEGTSPSGGASWALG